jgi:hypothetical protein
MRHGPLAALAALAMLVVACGTGSTGSRAPQGTTAPRPTVTAAVAATLAELTRVLGANRLQVVVPQVPYRPGEARELAAAPRAVVQVILPDDPTHGYISVYDFPTDAAAREAADAQATYVASGPGRVQFPPDTRFTIRQLASTVVFYAWSPGSTTDELAPEIEPVLRTIGTEVPVPR